MIYKMKIKYIKHENVRENIGGIGKDAGCSAEVFMQAYTVRFLPRF
jgi:hypothetical protein